jgi:hypothetical protein
MGPHYCSGDDTHVVLGWSALLSVQGNVRVPGTTNQRYAIQYRR